MSLNTAIDLPTGVVVDDQLGHGTPAAVDRQHHILAALRCRQVEVADGAVFQANVNDQHASRPGCLPNIIFLTNTALVLIIGFTGLLRALKVGDDSLCSLGNHGLASIEMDIIAP